MRRWRRFVLALALVGSLAEATSTTVVPAESVSDRKRAALALVHDDPASAEAKLRALVKETGEDPAVLFAIGLLTSERGHRQEAGRKRQSLLREARDWYSRAQAAGSREPLVATFLAAVNADGTEQTSTFSADERVNAILREGEDAFGRHDYAKAIDRYQAALVLAPSHYEATLYIGDAYFASGDNFQAATWFSKASQLDPNRETAFRYCGDVLLRSDKRDLAIEQYVQAVVAEPYNAYPWRTLQGIGLRPQVPAAGVPTAVVHPDKDGKAAIELGPNSTVLDIAYATARAKWQTEHPSPAGSPYRQSLDEERSSLETMLQVWHELEAAKTDDPKQIEARRRLAAPMKELEEVVRAELLEAHILLGRANENLSHDFVAYRNAHREKVREYVTKFLLHLP